MHPDGELVVVGAHLTTYTHRLYDSELADVDTGYFHNVDSLSFSPDGAYLALGLTLDGAIIEDWTGEAEPVNPHGGYDNFVAFGPDSLTLASGNRSGEVWLWSVEGEELAVLTDGDHEYLRGLTFHPSGEQVASLEWTDEGTVNIWSVPDQTLLKKIELDILVGCTNNPISYSSEGSYFAAYFEEDWEPFIRILDTEHIIWF